MAPPNIVYIHSHDTGRCLQPYGHAVPAPNLQKLAEEGVLFRQACCVAPTSSPSRAGLLTGQWAHLTGMLGLAHRGWSLSHPTRMLSHVLRAAGFRTVLGGVQHVARGEQKPDLGYETILDGPNNVAEAAPRAAAWIRGAAREPFFLDIGFTETHRKFHEPGPAEDARYTLPPATLPDAPRVRADMAAFKASARVLDAGAGQVLSALAERGVLDNTLVLSTTDHGIAFPGMKCNLTDQGIGVSMILRGPGGFRGGQVCDALVSHVDVFPTLCAAAGVAPPEWLNGTPLQPLVRGERSEVRDELFAEVTYHAAYEPQRGVRTKRWKYIRRYDGRTTVNQPNCDDGPSKREWLELGWREQPVPPEALYDLAFDPGETHNLAAAPMASAALGEMRERLERWMKATGDPLLKGPVPAPPGAKVNDPNGLSPSEPLRDAPK